MVLEGCVVVDAAAAAAQCGWPAWRDVHKDDDDDDDDDDAAALPRRSRIVCVFASIAVCLCIVIGVGWGGRRKNESVMMTR